MFRKFQAFVLLGLTAIAFGFASSASAAEICRSSIAKVSSITEWKPCDVWCKGDAGQQLIRCNGKKMGGTALLIRAANGTHYVISDGNGKRLSNNYANACDALLSWCNR